MPSCLYSKMYTYEKTKEVKIGFVMVFFGGGINSLKAEEVQGRLKITGGYEGKMKT